MAGTPRVETAVLASARPKWLAGLRHSAWPLPTPLYARCLLLFCGLCLVKVALVIEMRAQLIQTHLRMERHPQNWVDAAAFFLFVALGVWSLVGLGKACREVGNKAVRAANAAVLGVGLLFIFLTFHPVYQNYLYPIMSRVLGWESLVPYLANNLFFDPPFLALWLGGYSLAYYLLARRGKERQTPYLTAAAMGTYAMLCLRGLESYRDDLLVADCLGLASVLVAARADKERSLGWLIFPVLWVLSAWALFRLFNPSRAADPYSVLLAADGLVVFGGLVLWARRWGFLQAWSVRLPFFFTAFLLLTNTNYPESEDYTNVLRLVLEFPHYFLGELGLVSLLAVIGVVYASLRPRGAWWWLDLVSLLLAALALADFRLCQVMGVRLDWSVLSFGDDPKMMLRLARSYLPGLAGVLGLLTGAYLLGLRVILRRSGSAFPAPLAGRRHTGLVYSAVCLLTLGFLGWTLTETDSAEGQTAFRLVCTCPIWQHMASPPMDRDDFLRHAMSLGLGTFEPPHSRPTSGKPADLNVLLVFMESSYNQHLALFGSAEETQPLLSKYKNRMELFPNFFSNFAGSIYARFAAFTSLYPVGDYRRFTSDHVRVKSLFEVLHDHGYACTLFYSSFLDYTGFRDFLRGRGLDGVYDADTMPGQRSTPPLAWGLREEETLEAIRSQIQKYGGSRQRFFLTYVPAAPHFPYDGIPRSFKKFSPGEMGDYTPIYLNELLYMDWVIASIVDQLKEADLLDHTLVIITNDHGEMLGAKGGPIGHGWAMTPELANTPLIVMDPRNPGYHLNDTPGSQIDLLPTVLDLLGIPIPADELYEGRSLQAEPVTDKRLVYLNAFQQYAVLSGKHLILGQRSADAKAKDKPRGVYVMSNQASKTVFTPQSPSLDPPPSIREFDDFQENLLRHYSLYQNCLRRSPAYTRR